jgi:hypothetical protein
MEKQKNKRKRVKPTREKREENDDEIETPPKGRKKVKKEESDEEIDQEDVPDLEDIPKQLKILCNHDSTYHNFQSNEIQEIRKNMLEWYDKSKRDLPWREKDADPDADENDTEGNKRGYAVWVSEIMLQQTRYSFSS